MLKTILFLFFNLIHANITFTKELKENNHPALLDVNITKIKGNIETTVSRNILTLNYTQNETVIFSN